MGVYLIIVYLLLISCNFRRFIDHSYPFYLLLLLILLLVIIHCSKWQTLYYLHSQIKSVDNNTKTYRLVYMMNFIQGTFTGYFYVGVGGGRVLYAVRLRITSLSDIVIINKFHYHFYCCCYIHRAIRIGENKQIHNRKIDLAFS